MPAPYHVSASTNPVLRKLVSAWRDGATLSSHPDWCHSAVESDVERPWRTSHCVDETRHSRTLTLWFYLLQTVEKTIYGDMI